MSNDKRDPYDMSRIIPAGQGWGLSEGVGTRTPEERQVAEMKERARRKGRRTKELWKKV